jgi:hypothetical protein
MDRALINATRQSTKLLYAGAVLLGGAALILGVGVLSQQISPSVSVPGLGVGFALTIGAALFALYAVRCPRCKLAWVRWSFRNQSHGQWLQWLYEFTTCPRCGATASTLESGSVQPNSTVEPDARKSGARGSP